MSIKESIYNGIVPISDEFIKENIHIINLQDIVFIRFDFMKGNHNYDSKNIQLQNFYDYRISGL